MPGDLETIVHELEIGLLSLRSHVDLENSRIQHDISTMGTALEALKKKQEELTVAQKEQDEDFTDRFVSNERYKPVERLVLGGAGLILIAVVTAIVALVVR